MNDATISETDTTPIPVCSVRMRCHTTWYTSAAAPLRKKARPRRVMGGGRF